MNPLDEPSAGSDGTSQSISCVAMAAKHALVYSKLVSRRIEGDQTLSIPYLNRTGVPVRHMPLASSGGQAGCLYDRVEGT
jgi:hypothetical protein